MRGIIDQIEASKKTSDANAEARLQMDILVVSRMSWLFKLINSFLV